MQILVEVANIQVRSLKTEVEKGSACTVIVRGLVGPKAQANAGLKWRRQIHLWTASQGPKGKRVNIPAPRRGERVSPRRVVRRRKRTCRRRL